MTPPVLTRALDERGLPLVGIEGPDGLSAVVTYQRTVIGIESLHILVPPGAPPYFAAVAARYGQPAALQVLAQVDACARGAA